MKITPHTAQQRKYLVFSAQTCRPGWSGEKHNSSVEFNILLGGRNVGFIDQTEKLCCWSGGGGVVYCSGGGGVGVVVKYKHYSVL